MSPPFLGLRTTVYPVTDLEKAKAWYSKLLGVAPYFDEPFYVGFNVGGFELGLDPDTSELKPGAGGAVAYWGVEDAVITSYSIHYTKLYETWPACSRRNPSWSWRREDKSHAPSHSWTSRSSRKGLARRITSYNVCYTKLLRDTAGPAGPLRP